MYKIIFRLKLVSKELIKEGIDAETGLTFLEKSKRSVKQSEINKSIFFQETLPDCEEKYWKKDTDSIIEMSNDEKNIVDSDLALKNRIDTLNWHYSENNIRVKVPQELLMPNGDYFDFYFKLSLDKAPYEQLKNGTIATLVYLTYLNVSDGFSIVDNVIVPNDPRLIVESLKTPVLIDGKIY